MFRHIIARLERNVCNRAAIVFERRGIAFRFAAVFHAFCGQQRVPRFQANHLPDDQPGAAQQDECREQEGNRNAENLLHHSKLAQAFAGSKALNFINRRIIDGVMQAAAFFTRHRMFDNDVSDVNNITQLADLL